MTYQGIMSIHNFIGLITFQAIPVQSGLQSQLNLQSRQCCTKSVIPLYVRNTKLHSCFLVVPQCTLTETVTVCLLLYTHSNANKRQIRWFRGGSNPHSNYSNSVKSRLTLLKALELVTWPHYNHLTMFYQWLFNTNRFSFRVTD